MTNNPGFSDAACEASLNALTALVNGGSIEIYAGTQPADANTAPSGDTLLVTLTLNATAFASATVSGVAPSRIASALANAITSGTAVATGTAAWMRWYNSSSQGVWDGSVGTSGCDLNLSSASITSGTPVAITSFTVSQPEQ